MFSISGLCFSGSTTFPILSLGQRYGAVAITAVDFCHMGIATNPKEAWEKAASLTVFSLSAWEQEKNCPLSAFLGLCEEGLIIGIPADSYTRSNKNKEYAVKAVELLRKRPGLAGDVAYLWNTVKRELSIKRLSHDCQMDVVTALWNAGFINCKMVCNSASTVSPSIKNTGATVVPITT